MGFLKFLVWTGCAVGLGVFLASGNVEGRTPWEYAQRQWNRHVRPSGVDRDVDREVERVTEGVRDAFEDARDAVNRKTKQAAAPAPREHITHEDRAEINRIIAQKK
jgi:hypothetical protein